MIESISVSNFKSIKSLTAKLSQLTVFVGKNGAGKTNIIQSICLLKDIIAGETIDDAVSKITLVPSELFHGNETQHNLTIKATIKTDEGVRYSIELSVEHLGESDKTSGLKISHEKVEKIFSQSKSELIFERRQNVLSNKEGKKIPLSVSHEKSAILLYDNPNAEAIRSFFKKTKIILDMESNMLAESFSESGKDSLASSLMHLKHQNPDSFVKFQEILHEMLPSYSQILDYPTPGGTQEEQKSYLVLLEEKGVKGRLSMKLASAGDLRTLYLLATALDAKKNSTLVFEEIENGMHPERLILLLSYIRNISIINTVQVIFTTHSPLVINKLAPQDVLYIEKTTSQGTTSTPLGEHDKLGEIEKVLNEGGVLSDYLGLKE